MDGIISEGFMMAGKQISKYRKMIDDIFESLYGSSIDENGGDYEDVYYHESLEMEADYQEYMECMNIIHAQISANEIMRFIIYTEYMHIGNNRLIENNLNLRKLNEVAEELLEC